MESGWLEDNRLVALFFGSAVLALVVSLVLGAFDIAGINNMAMAHLLMALAWFFAAVGICLIDSPLFTVRVKSFWVLVVTIILGGLDFWMMTERAKIDVANSVEVGLRFVYPNGPALELINLSDGGVAYDIKYTVMLWNLNLPERLDPLPIPVSTFDWIKPRMRGGPQNLFFTPGVESLLHSGDHLFGCASVTCPACIRDHAYVVSIIWKQGGWFADISDGNEGRCFRPTVITRGGIVAYVKGLSLEVPESSRIPIQ